MKKIKQSRKKTKRSAATETRGAKPLPERKRRRHQPMKLNDEEKEYCDAEAAAAGMDTSPWCRMKCGLPD